MADAITKTPIPDTPPSKSGATQSSVKNIAIIKQTCIDEGLDSKYAICALLGIVGVESKWMPVAESSAYKKGTLLKKGATPDDAEKYGSDAGGVNLSKKEFFGWFYGKFKKTKGFGNGQYYGRGFVQLTGEGNYKFYAKALNIDIVNKPELLEGNDTATAELCAKVLVAFIKQRCKELGHNWKTEQHTPGFIYTALSAVNPGDKAGSNSHSLKLSYYEYFLGGKADAAPTNKDATNTSVNKTPKEIAAASASKKEAYTEDRTNNFSTDGFTDPEGKYPLRDFMNEPDTNRLARGVTEGTHIKYKDAIRKIGIPIANNGGADRGEQSGLWDEPLSSYNTVYPMNKVFESEAGHVLEFDDSPDGERVNIYHSKGTFIEINPDGSQINHIVGDSFHIVENNGNVFINGTCNITVASELNILCQGNANIEVNGTVDLVVHDDLNIGVANDLNIAVGGEYNLLVEGNCNTQVGKTMNSRAVGSLSLESTDALKLKTAKTMSMEGGDTASTAETLMKMSSSFKLETPADFQIKAKTFTLDIEEASEIKTKTLLIQTDRTTKIKTEDFQLDTKNRTIILSGEILATASSQDGFLQLNSSNILSFNSDNILSGTAPIIDLNGSTIPPVGITPISNVIKPLDPLGTPKKPVDFGGDPIENREPEQVLVDTALSPIGKSNPDSITDKAVNALIAGKTPTLSDILGSNGVDGISMTNLGSLGGIINAISQTIDSLYGAAPANLIPDIYSTKFTGPLESKSSLSISGGATNPYSKLKIPPYIGSSLSPHLNIDPPGRHSEGTSKYESPDDWDTAAGQQMENKISSTSDYEHNHVDPSASESTTATGGTSSSTSLSKDKQDDINGRSDYPLSYQLSDHFTLGMLLKDGSLQEQTVGTTLFTKQMIITNLSELCINILEPIYKELGVCQGGGGGATWRISDGFRPNNRKGSKGSKTSHHLKGRAVDIQLVSPNKIADLYDLCVKLENILPYQECFLEYAHEGTSRWIHLAYDRNDHTKEVTTQVEWKKKSGVLEKLYS